MAYGKKSRDAARTPGYQDFKAALDAGTVQNAYLFYGEESFLREHALAELRRALVEGPFETFNYHALEGKELAAEALVELAEAMPMMAERTLIAVTDWDLFKLSEEQRARLIALLEDLPPYCCIVFVYDTLSYSPNKTMKKLLGALEAHVQTVEFRAQESGQLTKWIARHFRELGKEIDRPTAEYLIFLCGDLMTGLNQEIEKIGAYAQGKVITQKDIDAVADPILSAEIFKLTDAVTGGNYNSAAAILSNLLKMQEEPIKILAALGSQLRRLYTARLALDSGKGKAWLMDLWGMRSDYPAKLLLAAAQKTTASWCADAVKQCQVLDRRMKSEKGCDSVGELKLLLVRLGAQRA